MNDLLQACIRCSFASCNGKCICRAGSASVAVEQRVADKFCPKDLFANAKPTDGATFVGKVPVSRQIKEDGPAIWKRIHRAALDDTEHFPAIVATEIAALPCGDCKTHARDYVTSNPPPASTPEDCFAWSWKFHDSVSERIGAKRITLAAALAEHQNRVSGI